jgi:hypothetical protein
MTGTTSLAELIVLIDRLSGDAPLTWSTEGIDDGCFFCGADATYASGLKHRFAVHKADCSWVEARRLLGHDIAPHQVAGVSS